MTRYEIDGDGRMVETTDTHAVPPGWSVTNTYGNTVAMAPGPTAAQMTATANEGSGDDGSDRAGPGQPDS